MKSKFKLVIGGIAGVVLLGGAVGVGAISNSGDKTGKAVSAQQELISKEEAKNIASKETKGTVENIELDEEDGRMEYDVDLHNEKDDDIDVEINAVNGKVLKVDYDRDDRDDDNDSEASADVKITKEQAIKIAQKEQKGTITEIELDDGHYEVEIHDGNKETEMKIDGNTGKVLEKDTETDDD
ncbi:PepSY domain-containing protein [Bacillus seohaeanensis]|jgi:uncharacterized membrane protein YkoI|uniref:PepSY domain-containing protein n=1 Tax=Bacillus seohaeanensis TaxID=284580 RepID=A0ABW5RP29_9BACI